MINTSEPTMERRQQVLLGHLSPQQQQQQQIGEIHQNLSHSTVATVSIEHSSTSATMNDMNVNLTGVNPEEVYVPHYHSTFKNTHIHIHL
jgi:Spy/CpxP family protein refolding chaperone